MNKPNDGAKPVPVPLRVGEKKSTPPKKRVKVSFEEAAQILLSEDAPLLRKLVK